ncbi:MAG: 50S ribosomal protein L2, partial [Bacteroidia bacterium]|nr:50S ribosomal protein L2 [Bacteroidia bacterium]
GRNNDGKRTVRMRGGGHKRKYRLIDFKRDKDGMAATVLRLEYDPNRTAFIALLEYEDGERRYILAPDKLVPGMKVYSGSGVEPAVGNCMPLKDMPIGAFVHNVELYPGRGGSIARSAGTYAQLSQKEGRYAVLKMPSGEIRRVPATCRATIGVVGNADHENISLGKAGRSRWLGRRPRVRGVAMNPIDHPMGGGEGRASGGLPRSRKGQYAKGLKTRDKKKNSNRLIISRRKKSKD